MGKKVRDTRVYQIPYNNLGTLIGDPRFAQALGYKLRDSGPMGNGYSFRFSHDITLISYGEYITIQLIPTGPSSTQVEVESACVMPTQIFDWGANKKNIDTLFRYIDGTFAQPMQQQFSQPVQQQYTQPVQQPMQQYTQPVQQQYAQPVQQPVQQYAAPQGNYCNHCGNPVPAGSRFCGRCGAQMG